MKSYKQILEAVNRGIQLALDDFDDEEQVQNVKSKQVQNRDYTKEYLDLMRNTVDFNLPSGNLWYKYNLDVNPNQLSTPEDWYGGYYAWGELEPKDNYSTVNYKFNRVIYDNMHTIIQLTKYCHDPADGYKGYSDNLTQLEPEDDVVHMKLGLNYYIPTANDFIELFNNTTFTLRKHFKGIKGLNGLEFIGKDEINQRIFIPFAGLKCKKSNLNPVGESCVGFEMHLWSSTFENCMTNKAISAIARQYQIESGWEKVQLIEMILNLLDCLYVQYIEKIKKRNLN